MKYTMLFLAGRRYEERMLSGFNLEEKIERLGTREIQLHEIHNALLARRYEVRE